MKSKNIPYQECDGIGTVIYLAKDGKFAGSILIADTIKPETEDAIRGLKAAGIRRTVMLTGDRKAVGEAVAAKVGIDQAYTELLPADKVQKVEEMLAEMTGKRKLAFVGDASTMHRFSPAQMSVLQWEAWEVTRRSRRRTLS